MVTHNIHNLASRIVRLTTRAEHIRGLMFRKKEDAAYLFIFPNERKIPLHMFFVFFPIDILWVNTEGQIIDLKKRVLPFTPSVFHRGKAKYVVELPAGTLSEHKVALMDSIKF